MKNRGHTAFGWLSSALLVSGLAVWQTPAAQGEQSAPVLGLADSVIETFHDSETNRCGPTKVHIDSPLRAFEDQNNVIHLTVSDPGARGWQWTGSAASFTNRPSTAKLDCASVMAGSTGNNNIPSYNQKTWIQALYFAAPTVYAYGHEDYFGTRTVEPGCHDAGTSDGNPYCWYAAIGTWQASVPASGTHLTFYETATAPDHVAVYPHVRYPGHANTPKAGWIGYGTPSNIFRGRNNEGQLDGNHYMFVYTNSGYGGQPTGVCLFRSADPTRPDSWRAWNGSTTVAAFDQQMRNPYVATNRPCAVVNPSVFQSSVRSIQWHEPSGHYIAIFRDGEGVKYATSRNLLNWNPPRTLLVSTKDTASYPVAIDFDGGDWGDHNFDRLYSNGKSYLYYRKTIESGHTRITRRAITVTNYPADLPGPG